MSRALLQAVEKTAGPYLRAFAPTTGIPVAFWAALTANESGLYCLQGRDPRDFPPRFEPLVYRHLLDVVAGKAKVYAGLDGEELQRGEEAQLNPRTGAFHARFLTEQWAENKGQDLSHLRDDALRNLASSWGFTQVMGYHILEWGDTVDDLADPDAHYGYAAHLMAEFVSQYGLDIRIDFEEMARCWNTGRPDGKTYDAAYVQNLFARMND